MQNEEALAPIRELFQDADLRERLDRAKSEEEALGVLVATGARNDVSFTADSLRRLVEIFASPRRKPPKDGELDDVSGERMRGTHGHMSCCTECPSSSALCCGVREF